MPVRSQFAAFAFTAAFSISAHGASTYYVGNSLTYDANWAGINDLNTRIGTNGEYGFHIKCSSGLDQIYTSPTEVCVPDTKYGTFTQSLATHQWDRISLEPYYDPIGPTNGAAGRFRDFVNLSKSKGNNANSDYFMYAAWPGGSDSANFNYSARWATPYSASDDGGTSMSRDYFSKIYTELSGDASLNGHLYVVPAGEVVFELDQRMKRGDIAGFSSAKDLYRDSLHFNDYGRYAAALTTFAVMNRTSPIGLDVPGWYQNQVVIDPATRLALQTAVWDVVTQNAAITGVPEPTSLTALAVGGVLLGRRRRGA